MAITTQNYTNKKSIAIKDKKVLYCLSVVVQLIKKMGTGFIKMKPNNFYNDRKEKY